MFVPSPEIVTNPAMLYIAIGIIGATVMPHNLYLHSSIVQTRAYAAHRRGQARRHQVGHDRFDHRADAGAVRQRLDPDRRGRRLPRHRHQDVAEIGDAYQLLSPLLGLGIASTLFAVALLASGLNSTVTATLAGQIVMEGFLRLRLPHWARRLVTRGLAIIPVVVVTALYGEKGTGRAPGVQPGHPVDAASLRRHPAGAVRLRPEEDGQPRHSARRVVDWPGSSPASFWC